MPHYFENSPLDDVMTRAIKKYMQERRRDPETGYWNDECEFIGKILKAEDWSYERCEQDSNFWFYYDKILDALDIDEPSTGKLHALADEARDLLCKYFKNNTSMKSNTKLHTDTDAKEWSGEDGVVRLETKHGFYIERAGIWLDIPSDGITVKIKRYWMHVYGGYDDDKVLLFNIWGDFIKAENIQDVFNVEALPLGSIGPKPQYKSMKETQKEIKEK